MECHFWLDVGLEHRTVHLEQGLALLFVSTAMSEVLITLTFVISPFTRECLTVPSILSVFWTFHIRLVRTFLSRRFGWFGYETSLYRARTNNLRKLTEGKRAL